MLVVVAVGTFAVLTLASRPSSYPSDRLVGWQLVGGPNHPMARVDDHVQHGLDFDPATAQTALMVPIAVDWIDCAPDDASWLATPDVTYTPTSVTITIHTTDAFGPITCGRRPGPSGEVSVGIILDVGIYVPVQLREPLGERSLFDGSRSPAEPRPIR